MGTVTIDQVVAFDILKPKPKPIIVSEATGRSAVDAVGVSVVSLRKRLRGLGMNELAIQLSCDGLQQIGGLLFHGPGGKSKHEYMKGVDSNA